MRRIVIDMAIACWTCALLLAFPMAVHASSTFASDVRGYDVGSLGWAVAMALFGGALRTIFTLASDSKLVQSAFRESWKDAIVAMIAGALAYIALEALRAANYFPVASEVRFAAVVFAGWSRLAFFGWINAFGVRVTDAVNERVARAIGDSIPTEPKK
jgi:hypothetical protein